LRKTKGKWEKTTGTFETDLFMVSSDYGVICDIRKSLPLNEQIPNALLISKAPEMLEMLNKVCKKLKGNGFPTLQKEIEQLIKEETEI
jgi:hypothetical protein